MAKVNGFWIPGDEVLYVDASGRSYGVFNKVMEIFCFPAKRSPTDPAYVLKGKTKKASNPPWVHVWIK